MDIDPSMSSSSSMLSFCFKTAAMLFTSASVGPFSLHRDAFRFARGDPLFAPPAARTLSTLCGMEERSMEHDDNRQRAVEHVPCAVSEYAIHWAALRCGTDLAEPGSLCLGGCHVRHDISSLRESRVVSSHFLVLPTGPLADVSSSSSSSSSSL